MRLGFLAVVAIVVAGAIALAQDRKSTEPAGQGGVAVFNSVEGRTVVVTSRPDGARVEKGDVVCELDPSELRDRLASQDSAVLGAQADVNGTRIAREVAVMTLIDYKEGGFKLEFATVAGEIKLAEAKLSRAEDRLDWARRMFEKGYVSMAEKVSEELGLKQVRFALEEAQSKKMVLVNHSQARTIKALTGAIESARARELASQARLERERSAQKRLTNEIDRCKIAAPVAGRIEYASPLGPGAIIRDGQLLFRVVPDGSAKSNVK